MDITDHISLAQILGHEKGVHLSDESQLKFSKKEGIYSNSYKSTGLLSSIASRIGLTFVARFFFPTTRKNFQEAHLIIVNLIRAKYGAEAAKSFENTFSSRLDWGSPLTVGSVRKFLANYTPVTTERNMVDFYGPKMASDYSRLFHHGTVTKTETRDLSVHFFDTSLPDQQETKTFLSPEISTLSQMGYLTGDVTGHDMLVSPGCVQVLGNTARSQLLQQGLYNPAARKKEIIALQATRETTLEEGSTRLTGLRESLAQSDMEPKTRTLIEDAVRIAEIQTDYFARQADLLSDVDSWSPKQLAAFAQMHAFVEEAKTAPDKKDKAIAKLQTKLEKLQSQLRELQEKSSTLQPASEDLTSSISRLETTIAKLKNDIETERDDLKRLKSTCDDILTQTHQTNDHWESWPPEEQLRFVRKHRLDPISFDRIKLKVNGKFLPCSDSKPFKENFGIFKQGLLELYPSGHSSITEDHFRELISLCDRNKTAAGTPSGAYNAEDHLPSFGQAAPLIPEEANSYEITLSPDKQSFDFHFDSGRTLLNSIIFHGGAEDALTPSFNYTADERRVSDEAASLPSDFPILERRCKFTWRYTPVNDEKGGNMGFGNLDLIDSRQGYWPLERKHAANLDARTRPLVDKARLAFETAINNPSDEASISSESREAHVWPDTFTDQPKVSQSFYRDLGSGSKKRGVCFLANGSGEPVHLIDQDNQNASSNGVDSALKPTEADLATACQKLVAFVGNDEQAFAISQYANQQVSPQILINNLGEAGVLFLPPYGAGASLGKLDYSFTFSKSQEGVITMAVSCKQKPKKFGFPSNDIDLTNDSYLNLDYNITFHFEKGKPQPHLEVGDVRYEYSFEEESESSAPVAVVEEPIKDRV